MAGTDWDAAPGADPEAVARAIVLRQLAQAPRTRAQLTATLNRRGVPEEVSERVLNRFVDVRLVDYAGFAETWVQSRHSSRGLARRALAYELRQRGVAEETAAQALATLEPDEERATAKQLATRSLAASRTLEPEVRIRRVASMLARKGYPVGVALTVVREALADEGVAELGRAASGQEDRLDGPD
jgi:regulatory protein